MNDRWLQMSLAQQLGNIGSEFTRMVNCKARGDLLNAEQSLLRNLDLIDLTLNDSRWANRLKELTRLREVICDLSHSDNYNSAAFLKDYFIQFALIARK